MHDHNQIIEKEELDRIIRDQKLRSNLTTECHYWFFQIYFAHYAKYKSADFQKELFSLTEDVSQKNLVIEAFRGSSKTTIMGTSYSIWSILGVQQKKFVLIIAKTESQARQYLANIKMELESNILLKSDLGPFEEPNDEWRAVSIVIPKYKARITVASVDNSIRGIKHGPHRPDLIICDDLEDLDIVKTAESRKKMFDWLTGDIIPLRDIDTRLIVIGTKLHNDSIIMKLKKEILEGRMPGATRAYPFLDSEGKSLWPDKFPTQIAIDEFRMSVPSLQAWQREYMLQIIADDDQVVRPEWIQTYRPSLLFVGGSYGKAEEAVDYYLSVFKDSKLGQRVKYETDQGPNKAGTVMFSGFKLWDTWFTAMDGGGEHKFAFNEGISFIVNCENQTELDYFWEKLSHVPEVEQCGWCKDKFGVSWQIIPKRMNEMMSSGTPEQNKKVTEAFLKMKKFDIAKLEEAYKA
jgi:predicted 3-demethylubiquinone-9 3-methyltransferase (glyoxalase superfamily)